jgi:hypothetical protein
VLTEQQQTTPWEEKMHNFLISLLRRAIAGLSGLVLASGFAFAQTQVPADIQFPDSPSRVITMEDGSELDVYNARVVRTRGSQLTVRFGDSSEEYRYSVPYDFRFNIDGRRVGVRDLGEGDTLNVYVKREPGAEPMFYEVDESGAAPVVGASVAATAAPQEETQQVAMLPSTASPVPLVGLFGVLLLALGGIGFAVSRRLS